MWSSSLPRAIGTTDVPGSAQLTTRPAMVSDPLADVEAASSWVFICTKGGTDPFKWTGKGPAKGGGGANMGGPQTVVWVTFLLGGNDGDIIV